MPDTSGMPINPGVAQPGGNSTNVGPGRLSNSRHNPGKLSSAGQNVDQTAPVVNSTANPPAMKTLVYSPDVRVIIAHNGKQYDVSSDIVRCSVHRAESQAASFFMTVANKGQRYTPINGAPPFSRMDRIVVYMKRTNMIQTFSGYLDTVPYKQLYPGTVDFKATCTAKRLMHTWWNPGLPNSQGLLDGTWKDNTVGDGQPGSRDSGMGSMLRRILVLVGGWSIANIHIQNFPTGFFDMLQKAALQQAGNNKVNDAALQAFEHQILMEDISPGPGATGGASGTAGTPGPFAGGAGVGSAAGAAAGATGVGTTFYVSQIVQACDDKGLGPLISTNNISAAQAQAGQTGEASRDQASAAAFKALQDANVNAQNNNKNSDAAIIGVAVSLVETGGGVAIHNYSNPAVPGSNAWGEGPPPYPPDLDSCGIFQQRNNGAWGTVDQRMNPKQSAGMFFGGLIQKVPNWRNMDPGAAAQQVQQSLNSQPKYSAAMSLATQLVQTYRTSTSTATAATSGASSVVGAAPSSSSSLVPGAASVTPAAGGVGAAAGKPVPDSEGAVNFMLSKVGNTPYVWGGKGPSGYDCSGLVQAAFAAIGVRTGGDTNAIRATVPQIPKSEAGRGDIYEPEGGHVTVLLGPPTSGSLLVQASTSHAPLSQQINVHPWYSGPSEWYGRACYNGGADPSSSYNPANMAIGSGVAPSGVAQSGWGTTQGSDGATEPIARNLFSYIFRPGSYAGPISQLWPKEKVFLDGQPLIQVVTAIAQASLRQWQSAPNGDLMFYYPDWWGLDGKPAVYELQDIELKDVRIDFSDDPLTTHVYIEGDYSMLGQADQVSGWMDTAGVATVEDNWLYQRLIKVAPGQPENWSGQALMQRFGVRPLKQTYAMAGTHELELILACQVFMEKWAQQFQTAIQMTFMPHLLPGMRVNLVNHNMSVYVTEVTHVCDFEQGFSTQAVIMAPSNPSGAALMKATVTATGPTSATDGGPGAAFTDPGSGLNNLLGAGSGTTP